MRQLEGWWLWWSRSRGDAVLAESVSTRLVCLFSEVFEMFGELFEVVEVCVCLVIVCESRCVEVEMRKRETQAREWETYSRESTQVLRGMVISTNSRRRGLSDVLVALLGGVICLPSVLIG